MATSLTELLDPQTQEEVFQILLSVYQANGFPVSSWQTGGSERTRLMAISTAIYDLSSGYIPAIASGGFTSLAALLETPDWIRLLASEIYSIDYNQATHTVGEILMTVATGSGPYNISVGGSYAIFTATGNRYISNEAIVLPAGPSATSVSFRAEFPGASYADPSSAVVSLVSSLPGVTLTNPATSYSSVAHSGSGTGTLTLGGSPVGTHRVIIRIDSTGASGVASWSYSIDGAAYVSAGAVASLTNMGGYGINVTLVNGGSGTSFVVFDTYSFSTPGSWITEQGADAETNAALATRCQQRWSSLSPIPVRDFYALLATSTPNVGSQVTQVVILQDQVINNQVNILVAGPEGALPGGVISLIQEYVNIRVPITDRPVVQSPVELDVTLSAVITVAAGSLSTAQTSIQAAMTNYIQSVGINGTIRIAAIIDEIMDVDGVIDVDGVEINGSATNLTLGGVSTFEIANLQPLDFTYVSS